MKEFLDKVLPFLTEIGIEYQLTTLEGTTFLPGLSMRAGVLCIDTARLLYPGDVLHEAGHLACMPPEIRATMHDDMEDTDLHRGGEMMAMAWSYAAALHLEIDPYVVFHENGYKGQSMQLVSSFASGNGIGLPLLQWCGMCYDQKNAYQLGKAAYPKMISWVCEKRPA